MRLESEHWFAYLLRVAVTGKPRAEFQFYLSTAGEGFANLIADKAECVLSTRQMRTVEQRRIEENQPKDLLPYSRAYVLAMDALVPVTMLGHPVRRISLSALAAMFSGEISS